MLLRVGRREGAERLERERRAHGAARTEWEAAFEAEVSSRVEREKAELEERAAAARNEQISRVVNKLGAYAQRESSLRPWGTGVL